MALVNENFLKLPVSYLFSDIAKKVNAFKVSHPTARVISLGIGDVTRHRGHRHAQRHQGD